MYPIDPNRKYMKGQKCSYQQLIATIWHYCNFDPPVVAVEKSGLSRQSVGKIYRKLGIRLREDSAPDFLLEIYRFLVEAGAGKWIPENVFNVGKFSDFFYDGLTKEYYRHMRETGKRPAEYRWAWQFFVILNEKWQGVPRKTFDDHMSVAVYRMVVTMQIQEAFKHAEENDQVECFYNEMTRQYPMLKRDIRSILDFGNVTHVMAASLLRDFHDRPL